MDVLEPRPDPGDDLRERLFLPGGITNIEARDTAEHLPRFGKFLQRRRPAATREKQTAQCPRPKSFIHTRPPDVHPEVPDSGIFPPARFLPGLWFSRLPRIVETAEHKICPPDTGRTCPCGPCKF